LPSTSCMTRHASFSSSAGSRCRRRAPSGPSRAASASRADTRSSPVSPAPTRTSRCNRFFTVLASGTRWKYKRGPIPSGSWHAQLEPRLSTGSEASYASHESNPGGIGGSTYPSTAFQNSATARGFAQSKVTCTCFTVDIVSLSIWQGCPTWNPRSRWRLRWLRMYGRLLGATGDGIPRRGCGNGNPL